MFPLLGGLASGIGSLIGASMTNDQSAANQQQMEAYNTQMSNTAYQRASADMKAAGLNPMMMASGGMSASTPTAPGISLQNPGNSVATGVNTAVQLKTADATVDKMAQEVANMKTDQVLRETQDVTERMKAPAIAADIGKTTAETRNIAARLPVDELAGGTARNVSSMNPVLKEKLDQAGYAGRAVESAVSPATDLVSSARGLKALGPQRSTSETTRDDGSSSFVERWNH